MPWHRFIDDHIFTAKGDRRWSKKFKKGCVVNLTREQVEHAAAAGKIEKAATPRKGTTA